MREPEHKYAAALPFITSKIHVLSWWESQRFARFFTRQNRLRVSKTGRAPSSNASFVPGSRGLILGARDLRPKLGFQNEDSENYWLNILACLWLKILRWFKASNPSCFDAFCIGRLIVRAPVHLLHELKIKDLKLDTFRKPSDQQDSLSPPFAIQVLEIHERQHPT